MGPGRPSDYTEEIAIDICTKIAEGNALTTICKQEDMPALRTVYLWLNKNAEFMHMYARAREDQADTLVDEILSIGDDGSNDTIVDEDGNVRTDGDVIQRSRLRVDARKWVAAKLKPRKYGDKMAVGGADDLPPVSISISAAELAKANKLIKDNDDC